MPNSDWAKTRINKRKLWIAENDKEIQRLRAENARFLQEINGIVDDHTRAGGESLWQYATGKVEEVKGGMDSLSFCGTCNKYQIPGHMSPGGECWTCFGVPRL